jgi:Arc/MetJ-type ribon-helix-helix transcriptional regulator
MTTKIAISLPDELVVSARRAVDEGRAASVSAYIAAAIEAFEVQEDLSGLLSDMAAAGGTPAAADRRWAREALGLA